MSQPCGMTPSWPSSKPCGKPATLGWESEVSKGDLVPICEDCIAWTGAERRFLKRLDREATP